MAYRRNMRFASDPKSSQGKAKQQRVTKSTISNTEKKLTHDIEAVATRHVKPNLLSVSPVQSPLTQSPTRAVASKIYPQIKGTPEDRTTRQLEGLKRARSPDSIAPVSRSHSSARRRENSHEEQVWEYRSQPRQIIEQVKLGPERPPSPSRDQIAQLENAPPQLVDIGAGTFINYDDWETMLYKSDSKFIRELALHLWSTEELAQRCMNTKTANRLKGPNDEMRLELTPQKYKVLKNCLDYKLTNINRVTGAPRKIRMDKLGRHMSQKIYDVRLKLGLTNSEGHDNTLND